MVDKTIKADKDMFFKDYKTNPHAQIRESLLWEYRKEDIDYGEMRNIIVQRVIERGRIDDFYAMLNMYGLNDIKKTIKDIAYLNNKDMAFVCAAFELNKEDLKCYTQKRLPNQHWNS